MSIKSVLHINTQDRIGGAARAMFRLHSRLLERGIQSRLLVGQLSEPDARVQSIRSPQRGVWNTLLNVTGAQYLFYLSSFRLPSHPWVQDSDVIHLHNTHGGYFAHTILPRLSQGHPIVWTLHDMWALTGHCSYSYECERWKTGCGSCPYLNEYPRLFVDSTHWLWRIKRATYARSHLTFVSPSRWLADFLRSSPLTSRFETHVIPNGIDTKIFHPVEKAKARARLGLPQDRPLIFWTGVKGQEHRKGKDFRDAVLASLKTSECATANIWLDAETNEQTVEGSATIVKRRHVSSEDEMCLYYSAADIFVLPARADNFPNTLLESLASGTPVVAFDVGGISELITHLHNGYLARPLDGNDLMHGIRLLLEDSALRAHLGENAERTINLNYDLDTQTNLYTDLYRAVIAEWQSRTNVESQTRA